MKYSNQNAASVQRNFDVKVFEIDPFFYVSMHHFDSKVTD